MEKLEIFIVGSTISIISLRRILKWIYAWVGPDKAKEAAEALIAEGCDALAFTEDTPAVIEVGQAHTEKGKQIIDQRKTNRVLVSYRANDAAGVQLSAWGDNKLNPPHGWKSQNITLISNKVVFKSDNGNRHQKELKNDY